MPSQAASCSTESAPVSIAHVASSIALTVPSHGPNRSTICAAGAWTMTRAWCRRLGRDAAGDEGLHLGVGDLARREAGTCEIPSRIRSIRKVRQSSRSRSQATRYQRWPAFTIRYGSTAPLRGLLPPVGVVEADRPALAGEAGDLGEHRRIDGRTLPAAPHVDRHALERRDLASEPRRQHLLQLGQRPQRRLLDPGHRALRRRPQPDRDRHRLVVVEQQRRHRGTGLEPVAADRAARRVDRVAEVAQALDVVAHGARADLEALGQLGARPVARRLEQREQPEESRRRRHRPNHTRY